MLIIAHLDIDAFFASVEERDRPRLKGRPIVVGSDPKDGKGRGVVSTANYKAREYGIHSAMPISRAWELSERARGRGFPQVVFITPSNRRYGEASDRITKVVRSSIAEAYPEISPVAILKASVDEMYIDLSFTMSFKKAEVLTRKIKNKIQITEKLSCSIGIGSNKLVAKIASDFKKPGGLVVINPDEVQKFISPLSIRKIPGIGPKTETRLKQMGISLISDLQKIPEEDLEKKFGKWGVDLYRKSRGEDDSLVAERQEAKSIGEQETFEKDTLNASFVTSRLDVLASTVFHRLQKNGFSLFKTVVVTIRFSGFITKSRSRTLPEPSNSLETLKFEALKLTYPFFDGRENPNRKKIRLIGVRVEKLG